MLSRATFIALSLSLALLSVSSLAHEDTGVRIPIPKRRSFINVDGTFDHHRAVQHNIHVANKYRQNMLTFQQNGDMASAHTTLASLSPGVASNTEWHGKRQKVPLDDEENDLEWAGHVKIGTPPVPFLIDFDTGSADLWVPSSACSNCGHRNKYNLSASSTSATKNGNFTIRYADGSMVSGPVYTDTVSIGGIKATQQYFAAVTTESSMFNDDPIDGVLGLAFRSISRLGHSPFFATAHAQKSAKDNTFAFKLASNGSELYLGGTNTALYEGPIDYHNISSANGYWIIGAAHAQVNGKNVVSKFETIIDSGTTIMYGPPAAVKKFYDAIPGSKLFDKTNDFYSYPCKTPPKVAFNWGGKTWVVSADNFNLGETKAGSGQCVGALSGDDLGLGDNVWLLGDSFMKNVYSVFSFSENAVGFATLK